MLDGIAPVQFIQGVNENAKFDYQQTINLQKYGVIAVQYKPKLSYCMTELEIMLAHELSKENLEECEVRLHTNYGNIPSMITLTEGRFIAENDQQASVQGIRGVRWQKASLKPIVVIRDETYWVVVIPGKMELHLLTAIGEDAYITPLCYKQYENWEVEPNFEKWGCMLRLYGRVLPIIS